MIYLGLYNDNHYVISAVNTIAEMSDGNMQIKDVNSVVISNMNCVFRANGQTWYESGVHWLTDIIGGLLLSGGLLCMYISAVLKIEQEDF